jgi:hypothetical protein
LLFFFSADMITSPFGFLILDELEMAGASQVAQ